jgi:rhomboid protease GluP
MTQRPDNRHEIDELLQRMEREFGSRPVGDGADSTQPAEQSPYGTSYGSPPEPPAQPPQRRVYASIVLVWIIGSIYVLTVVLSGNFTQPSLPVLVVLGAKVNDLIAAGQYWRLLTATLLHASLLHIFFNGFALYALGPETERIYGTRRFLALYWLAGLSGSIASYALSPAPAVGASGAIFGLIGGLGVFYYRNRQILGQFGRAQLRGMLAIAGINLLIGFAAQGTIDNWGHMGGLVGGALAGLALAPRLEVAPHIYPPVLRREFPSNGWAAAGALLVALVLLAGVLPPA